MAATFWHLLIANQLIHFFKSEKIHLQSTDCIVENKECFQAGSLGPDINFYPGGNDEIISLTHGDKPADLGRSLLTNAVSGKEKAYAYGWLLHITTDNIVHPLVNNMVVSKFPGKCPGNDFDMYPLGHHRIEWGIDLFLLQDSRFKHIIPDMDIALRSAEDLTPFLAKAFKQTFQFDLPLDKWQNAMENMIKYTGLFQKFWRVSGRMVDSNIFIQSIKSLFYHIIVKPIAHGAALRGHPSEAGIFIPVNPTEKDKHVIINFTEKARMAYLDHLSENFTNLPNNTG